jgi:hypothetical protein
MTDLELLILLKRAFKDYLNAPVEKQPSLLSMLDLMKFVREIITEEHKTQQKIENYDYKFDEREATGEI